MFKAYIDKINARESVIREPITGKMSKNAEFQSLVGDIYNYHLIIMQPPVEETDTTMTDTHMRNLLIKGIQDNADVVADFICDNVQELAVPLMTYGSTKSVSDISTQIWKKKELKAKLDTAEREDTILQCIMQYMGDINPNGKEDDK